ncbi:MAG: SUMF1/EgtB/PvdO family nonheme iron enzyme [Nitrospirota bacterium]
MRHARCSLVAFASVLASALLPLPASAAIQEFQQPDAYAVVIGISQYREEVIPKVAYAVQDAQAVAKLLETQAGIPRSHIRLLTDAKATGNDLRTVSQWLRMRVKPESVVYVYYAGHGTPDPKTGDAFLVPWDGHPDYPDGLYPLKALYESLNALPAKQVLVLLDSCFSGSVGRSLLAKGARPMVLSLENPLLAAGKVVVLAASTGTQISSDYDKAGHGLFTYALLTGLHGEADQDKDGLVTLKELYPYVRKQVAETAVEELNREQTPVLLPGEEVLGVRSALPVTVARARPYEALRQTGREITGKDGAPMVLVPAGEFIMGSNDGDADEKPERRVTLEAFYIDKYEVSTKLYATFIQDTRRAQPSDWSQQVALVGSGDRPVVNVTWHDADAYCRHYGKRLPTEQEWEKAARGTDGRKYPWGNEEPSSRHALFNTRWNGYGTLATVESYEAGKSPYGLYHMAGNVWEWTSSDYDNSTKVLRGGSWLYNAGLVRSADRYRVDPSLRLSDLGFRCAQDAR